ncbi:hypothetical protein FRB91_003836 [Serendipita sp. 411]|nr:hypothetical protein FRC18_004323 [Serendipita sp. 400]KAG8842906.1 hypothetical protein FRB91_003836 [Serendipita sp. 411]
MILSSALLSLFLVANKVQALSPPVPTVTVSTSRRIISATPTATPTPTPSTSRTTSSACVGWNCGSTSCLPSSTQLVYYVCYERCLGTSTKTYLTTTYAPPVTTTIPCGPVPVPYVKKSALEGGEEVDLEKRWTCAPGPTLTPTVTYLPCETCTVYPRSTTITNVVGSTVTVSKSCSPTRTTAKPTSTTSRIPLPQDPCWWTCYDSNKVYTTLPYTPSATATPTGYVWCGLACV